MRTISAIQLLLVFAVIFSLSSLPGPLSAAFYHLPTIPIARANPAPAQTWTPGGAASNSFLASIFSSESTEFTSQLAQTIDFMDWPLTPTQITCLNTGDPTACGTPGINPANYFVTSPISEHGEFEVEFDLANQFWGIPAQFGNSVKGVQIRQAFDHVVDRASFVTNDPFLGGKATTLDNPVPTSDGLVSPNSCAWDLLGLNAPSTSPGCAVGPSYTSGTTTVDTGGTAYHIGGDTAMPGGVGVWQPGPGSPDLNAAAAHFVAAGIATGFSTTTSILTGINTTAVASPPTFFIRNDNFPRLDLGTSMAEDICYLLTGSITLGTSACAGTVAGTTSHGLNLLFAPISTAVSLIFTTPGKSATSPNLGWWTYTAGFGGVFPFDSLNFFLYNSQFVDLNGLPAGTPCTTTVGSTSASNYMYVCVPQIDTWSSAMEFSNCVSAAGDPIPGSTSNSFSGTCASATGTCGVTNPTACSAVSAGFHEDDIFGSMALTLPDFSQKNQFGYLSNYNVGAINSQGAGTPQFFTWLNAWLPSSAVRAGIGQVPLTIRQGFKQTTTSLSPYQASTVWDFFILGNIYDSLYASNPINNNNFFNWMTTSSQIICSPTSVTCTSTLLGYTPPSGTKAVIRSFLRNDMFWHDSVGSNQPVTAWDVRFSDLTLKATGAFQGAVLAPLLDVHLLSTIEFDLDLNAIGPFTQLTIGGPTIIPGHLWSTGASTWNSGAGPTDATMLANSSGGAIASGGTGPSSSAKFDPVAAGILVGSSAWSCQNTGTDTSTAVGHFGSGCTSSNTQAPGIGGTWTLTRYGCALSSTGTACTGPNQNISPNQSPYFRSSGRVAQWIWSGMNGNFIHDFTNLSVVGFCFQKAPGTTNCAQFQSGIGNPADTSDFPCTLAGFANHCVGFNTYSEVAKLLGISLVAAAPNSPGSSGLWTDPYFVGIATGPALSPSGDGVPAPILYEGANTLNPASIVGCTTSYTNGSPSTGGYDC